jgi:hypothetical protein
MIDGLVKSRLTGENRCPVYLLLSEIIPLKAGLSPE